MLIQDSYSQLLRPST